MNNQTTMNSYNEQSFTAAMREHKGTMFQADGLNAMLSVFAMSEHLGLKVIPTAEELAA